MINTNLPPILHRFQVWLIIGQIFASESGLPHFNALPANITINDVLLKLHSLAYIAAAESNGDLIPLLRNPLQKLQNFMKLLGGWDYYAIQGHRRSPSLVPIESSYVTSY